jgi:hypothetical protein
MVCQACQAVVQESQDCRVVVRESRAYQAVVQESRGRQDMIQGSRGRQVHTLVVGRVGTVLTEVLHYRAGQVNQDREPGRGPSPATGLAACPG